MKTFVKFGMSFIFLLNILIVLVAAIFSMPGEYPISFARKFQTGTLYFPSMVKVIIFWVAVILMFIFLIGIIVVLFWRNKKKDLVLKDTENDELVIQKEAMQSMVKKTVADSELFLAYTTKVKIKKNDRIDCKIAGDVAFSRNFSGKFDRLKLEIETMIRAMLGIGGEQVKLRIVVKSNEKAKKAKNEPRVV